MWTSCLGVVQAGELIIPGIPRANGECPIQLGHTPNLAWNLLLHTLLAILLSYLFTFYDFGALHDFFDQDLHDISFFQFFAVLEFHESLRVVLEAQVESVSLLLG